MKLRRPNLLACLAIALFAAAVLAETIHVTLRPGEELRIVIASPATQPVESPATQPSLPEPPAITLLAETLGGVPHLGLRLEGPARDHPVKLYVRTKAATELAGTLLPGSNLLLWPGSAAVPLRDGWEYWAWGVAETDAGQATGAEAHIRLAVQLPPPATKPIEGPFVERPDPVYTSPPANARVARDADTADRLLEQNRKDGHPTVIRDFVSPRSFRLKSGNRDVWFINVTFRNLPGGMFTCPITSENGVGNLYIHRCTFERNGAGVFLFDFRGEIVGNTFRDGGQAIGILWNNHKSPATGITISHNVAERLKGHDFELRTEHPQRWGSLGPTVIGAKFNYNQSIGSPGLPHRSMIYSIATGHARDCEAIGNYSEGGEWAFEVMNGWRFAGNVAVNCDAMFAINTLSRLVHIDTGNRAIGVRVPVMPYVGDKGAPTGMQPAWKIAEVARQ